MASSLFSALDSLVGLAQHGVDVKPTLLRVLTDLYVQKPSHTADEEQQFVELAVRLIGAVDPHTRRIVADKLAAYPGAPADILDRLQADDRDEADVPAPVPASSPTAEPVASASDPSRLSERFFTGDADERRMILAELAGSHAPAAVRPDRADDISRALEAAVLGGRPSDFIRQLESAFGLPRVIVQRIVNDVSGEPLVVIARALAMPVDALQRVLMFINPAVGQSVRRVYALTSLHADVSPLAALRLIACWRETAAAQPAEQAPARTAPSNRPGRSVVPEWRRPAVSTARPAPGASSGHDPIKKMTS